MRAQFQNFAPPFFKSKNKIRKTLFFKKILKYRQHLKPPQYAHRWKAQTLNFLRTKNQTPPRKKVKSQNFC